MLDLQGFTWETGTGQKTWEQRFADLLKFKEAHGNCDVAKKNPDDPSLGMWVVNQRSNKKRGKLTAEHERLLNDVGFIWAKKAPKTK